MLTRTSSDEEPTVEGPGQSWGTVVALCGRYFAGRIDLLTRDRVKSLVPVTDSPFALAEAVDPGHGASEPASGRSDDRSLDRQDFSHQLATSSADYLVVDNTGALMRLCESDGRFHTFSKQRESEVVDLLWGGDREEAERHLVSPQHVGMTDELRAAYDAFVDVCLEHFDPSRIILVRSRVARFWATDEGELAPTNGNDRVACFLDQLDRHFSERTGCLVSNAVLGHVPTAAPWHSVDSALRVAIEDDVMRLMGLRDEDGRDGAELVPPCRRRTAAGHVIRALNNDRPVDGGWLRSYFREHPATHDDLLALAYLREQRPGRHRRLIRRCVAQAVGHPRSYPVATTRRRFERSLRVLRQWEWRSVRIPRRTPWRPHVVVTWDRAVLRFTRGGSIRLTELAEVGEPEAAAVVGGELPITPLNLAAVLRSWPVYLERGRRGVRAAPTVVVRNPRALLDTCSWLDWAWVSDSENVVITRDGAPRQARETGPHARTDLSFVFAPRTRIGTVGGGLMDQVTHIALFEQVCSSHGLDLYLDDFRYTWWRSHNGFEASRLAPALESRRMSRLVSPALLERFRTEVVKTRLPWVFSQSRAWYRLGLHEAFVVTRDYSNARRLVEIGPEFPFLVYEDDADLARYMERPPRPVTFFTTQHRIAISASSADAIGRVFDYRHLAASGLPARVAATAAALRERPHVAFHVRRGDYLNAHFDTNGWHADLEHYAAAIRFLIESDLTTDGFDVAVFSDDLAFVEQHAPAYGLDLVRGQVRFVGGNDHFDAIYDSYLMSLCPVIVGSVGFFAATTSLLAAPPSVFVKTKPGEVWVGWRREGDPGPAT